MPFNFESLRVLVVEDNQHMRHLIGQVLRAMGVGTILLAENGSRALQMSRTERPDIMITDWLMDPMDGLELTRAIRRDPQNPSRLVPIILMTGYSSHTRVTSARDIGITEFLVKPFTAEHLAKRIAHVINAPRDFIAAPKFVGPDRRRRPGDGYEGPHRRKRDDGDN